MKSSAPISIAVMRLSFTIVVGVAALNAQTTPANTAADHEPEDVVILPEFTVSTADDGSYMATESTSGTRMAAKILDLPYSVQVLTADFFTDFALLDLDDLAPFVSGMAAGDKNQGGGGGTRIRGFFTPYFRNGFYRRQAPDSNSIARVEIVKGPQSAIYGRVAPGGVINFISKKPQTRASSGLSHQVGNDHYARSEGWATGPIVADKLYYRIDAAYYEYNRPTDFWFNRTRNLSGSLTWKLSQNTSLTFEYEHTFRVMNDPQVWTRWLDANGYTHGSVWDMPDQELARRLTEFNINGAYRRTERLNDSYYLQLEHRFAPDLSLRANFGYSTRDFERHSTSTPNRWDTRVQNYVGAFNNLNWVDETKGIWTGLRSMSHLTIDDLQYGGQIDLTKTWRHAGAIRQRSLFTFDFFRDDTDQATWNLTGGALNNELAKLGITTAPLRNEWYRPDPFNPAVSGYQPIPDFNATGWAASDGGTFILERTYWGSLVNHTIDLLDGRLSLVGSARQDWAKYTRSQPLSTDPELYDSQTDAKRFTYSFGANYHLIPRRLVGYVSHGTAFDPAPQADRNTGELLGNKTARGSEVGFKGLLLNDTFSYTLSGYKVQQDNEATANPDNPGNSDPTLPALIPGGSTRGQGIGFDFSGRVTDNLTILGNFAWTDIWVHDNKSNPALIGTEPTGGQNGPTRSGAIAGRYNFNAGALRGLRLGITYQHYTRYLRFAGTSTSSPIYVPEKNEVAAMISYTRRFKQRRELTFTLNVANVFDEQEITINGYAPAGREIKFRTSFRF